MAFPALVTSTIRARVRRLLNEPTALNFTDGQIDDWIEEAARTISERTLGVEECNTAFQLATGDADYTYTTAGITDCIKIEALIYIGDNAYDGDVGASTTKAFALTKIHPRQTEHLTHVYSATAALNLPRYWWDVNNTIYIHPAPGSTYNLDYMLVLYYKKADIYETGATYYLPEELREYTIIYAYARALEANNKVSQSQQYMSIFDNFMAFHYTDRYFKPVDSKDMMTMPDRTQFAQQG